jgi:carbonic anhydrase/acetyltransferase-like protein (isoleucine patch superfamily)
MVQSAILSNGPVMGKEVFVAPGAVVLGKVVLKNLCSVWFGAVLRADLDQIVIGERSNIQDNSVIHVDSGHPTIIGHDVRIGHGCVIHGSHIGDHVLVGMHATLLNDVEIGEYSIIGANALCTSGFKVPPRTLALGSPARIIRELNDRELAMLKSQNDDYVRLAALYRAHYNL